MTAPRGLTISVVTATLTVIAGCGARQHSILQPNQPPEVELFAQNLNRSATGPAMFRFSWAANDPDGQVDHFLYSVGTLDQDDADRSWEQTTSREKIVSFERAAPAQDPEARELDEFRIFSLQAVDGFGARSSVTRIAINDDNVAPVIQITSPYPSPYARTYLQSTVCVQWDASDQDGYFSQKPVKYKYKLLTANTEVTFQTALSFPDSVRRYYAPRKWAGWDSVGPRATGVTLSNLVLGQDYMFVITCFDEQGAYAPIFSMQTNMLNMRIVTAGAQLPSLTMFNEYFSYTYQSGTFDPSRSIALEAPGYQPLTFNWYAQSQNGAPISAYRWALDITDIADNTQRSNESADLAHWSQWSLTTTSATLPPFPGGTHNLYIEAKQADLCGQSTLPSLGVVQFSVVQPTFSHSLLFVDDTRLPVDQHTIGNPDCVNRPIGLWPSAAELDTFLFARGWVPWRCYPAGNVSRPGIFSGYDFDTLGTRGFPVPSLSTLGNYQHVVWYVDRGAATKLHAPDDPSDPGTALRYMSDHNRSSTLAAYVAQGGKLWLAGGGAGSATMLPWDRTNNNSPYLAFSASNNELVPGRFMYDLVHWRSEFAATRAAIQINRELGRFTSSPGIYTSLPIAMQAKSLGAGDSFPPNRTVNFGDFYQSAFDVEFLDQPNAITEDIDPGEGYDEQSTLDTLFKAVSAGFPPGQINLCMTYYHGADNAPVIFSGFNFWNFRRTQCIQLVDFVLQQLWGIPRDPVTRGPNAIVTMDPRLPLGRSTRPAPETGRAAPVGAAARE